MKKIVAFSFALAFSVAPLSAHAVVNSINGQTALNQFLVSPGSNATNTMHMDIIQVGADTHRFRWDGTPWRVDQGGTGAIFFTAGSLLVGNGTGPLSTTYNAILNSITNVPGTELTIGSQQTDLITPNVRISAASSIVEGNDGGTVFVSGGNGPTEGTGGGGGNIYLQGGFAHNGESGGLGAVIEVAGGYNDGNGGELTLGSGAGGGDGFGGDIIITAGSHTSDPTKEGKIRLFSNGGSTTTIEFGRTDIGQKTCFNTSNIEGQAISFYFTGTTMVVENNLCQ